MQVILNNGGGQRGGSLEEWGVGGVRKGSRRKLGKNNNA